MIEAFKYEERYNKTKIKECSEILQYIYLNNDECFVRVLNKQTGKNKSYPINALKDPIKLRQIAKSYGEEDIMLSLNPFRTMGNATRKNLFCINAIAVDVDYRNVKAFKDLEPENVIKLLEMDFFGSRIPIPNLIEYGYQIRLIYGVETCYIPKKRDNVVTLARRISEVFAKELKDYGAEKQNLESYFRLPGSINSKNDSEVSMIFYDDSIRYTLNELQELWLDELPKWYKRRKGRKQAPKKVVKLHNIYSFNCNRLRDFEKIQRYINDIGVLELRAKLCFQYRNYTLIKLKYQNGKLNPQDYEFARQEMLKFNSNFKYPYRENVIESATRVVNYRQYLYKNETMLKFFNEGGSIEFDYDFCEELGLESIFKIKSREVRNKEYYERNGKKINKDRSKKYVEKLKEEGKLSKKEQIAQRQAKIKDLLAEGLKRKDICSQLNISVKTYKRDIIVLKEQGLL